MIEYYFTTLAQEDHNKIMVNCMKFMVLFVTVNYSFDIL